MSKVLRVGVVLAGDIVEERIFRAARGVTVGSSPRNDIFLPSSTLPRSYRLFSRGGGGWQLCCAPGVDGRLSGGGQVRTLQEAAQTGQAGRGGVICLPLTEQDRGKVRLGDVTLLFQFVEPPLVQPRPQLPPSVRGGLSTSIDWVLACCFLTIGLLHGGALAYMRTMDFPVKPEVDEILVGAIDGFIPVVTHKMPDPTEFNEVGETPVKPDPSPKPKNGGNGGKGKTNKPRPAAPCDQACKDAKAAVRRARLSKEVGNHGVLKIFGVKGKGGGVVKDLVKGGDPGQAVAKAFAGMGGVQMASKDNVPGLQGKGADGGGRLITAGRLGVVGPEEVSSGTMVKERVPTGTIKTAKPEIEGGDMGTDSTYRIIRSGMRCVQTQYQRGLKSDPELSGKLSVCLNVDPMGRVRLVEVEDDTLDAPSVLRGVKSCLKRLRFPPPRGGRAQVCVPFLLKPAS